MADLFTYLRRAQRLVHDTRQEAVNPADLIDYINEARTQLAGESAAIRVLGTLALIAGNRGPYAFSAINLSTPGAAGVLNIRQASFLLGDGQQMIISRPYEWFASYMLNNAVLNTGQPKTWSQFGQGGAGTIYVDPVPDGPYTMVLDCVCSPVPLTDGTTAELLPDPWTTAVPYYAAWVALMSLPPGPDTGDADRMFARYTLFVKRAREFSTPEVMPSQYPQSVSPTRSQQLGIAAGGG